MQLTVWTYEGPPHVGAMRVATAMTDVHYVLHGPQGDTYADLLFTMIERRDKRPPVTWTTFQAQDLGADTSAIFQTALRESYERFKPNAMLVGATCTAELIQDDPGGLADAMDLPIPVIPLELPSYQRKESWGASETFYQVVRHLTRGVTPEPGAVRENVIERAAGRRPSCNLLGPTALGFRHRDDIQEITQLLDDLGVDVHCVAPLGAATADIATLPDADFNVVLYPETGLQAAAYLERTFGMPMVRTVPMGVGATRDFAREVATLIGTDTEAAAAQVASRLPWYSRSVDSTYFTGKRVFIFGDATHAVAAARMAREEMGFEVVGLGAYNREFAREVRAAAKEIGVPALITDDYLEVEAAIREAAPELILGTQMERHIAKRLGTFCAVISAPVHVQDFPARYAPVYGAEGANVLFDTWVHPLVMGLEEHLLGMFQDDFEFADGRTPSHLASEHGTAASHPAPAGSTTPESGDGAVPGEHAAAGGATTAVRSARSTETTEAPAKAVEPAWTSDAEKELGRIPFFVRGKARRNTERFAADNGLPHITVETLYEAKAHYGGGRA